MPRLGLKRNWTREKVSGNVAGWLVVPASYKGAADGLEVACDRQELLLAANALPLQTVNAAGMAKLPLIRRLRA